MKRLLLLLTFMVTIGLTYGQTILISPTGDGGFETGATPAANNWTAVNSSTDGWYVGAVPVVSAGVNCAYISSTAGAAWTYSQISVIQHVYYDVTIPAGESKIKLTFKWKATGEGSTTSDWDNMKVFFGLSSSVGVPVANTAVSSTYQISGAGAISGMYKLNSAAWNSETINLTGTPGSTYRLVFSWKSDASTIANPPTAIDEVSLVSSTPDPLHGLYTINNLAPTSTPMLHDGTGNFISFTDAVNFMNENGISAAVTFNVSATQIFTEDCPAITATGTASNKIIFQKSGAGANPIVKPTGGAGTTDAGIIISGGDYITFDGIDITIAAGSAVEYGYFIRNASALDGAQNNVVKNSKITLNRANTSSRGIYQNVATTPTNATGANSYNAYRKNTIENSYNGIYLAGAAAYPDLTCIIDSNTVGAATANDIGNGTPATNGIRTTSQSGITISNCTVRNITGTGTGIVYGIYIENAQGNNVINNNLVYQLQTTNVSTSAIIYGIRTDINSTYTATVYNNMIYGLYHGIVTASATQVIRALAAGVSGTGTVNYYFNSVRIDENASPSSSILYINGGTVNLANNIFANFSTGGATSKRYAVNRVGGTIASSDRNDLYVLAGTNSFVGFATADRTTLSDWQTAISNDYNSLSIDPLFTSATDLHIVTGTTTQLESNGMVIAGITTDFDYQLRPGPAGSVWGGALFPDMGADEVDAITAFTCVAPVPGNTLSTLNPVCSGQAVTLSLQNATPGSGVLYQWQSSSDGVIYTNIPGATGLTYSYTPSANMYFQCVVTCLNGPSTGTSNPIQITFFNNVTGTTPATRCGTGTVNLSATGSAGTTLNWYSAITGGTFLGTGSPFTTPIISDTTTYYVGAEGVQVGIVNVGAGAGTTSTYSNPFYSNWSNVHTQHLITKEELIAAGLRAGNITSVALDFTSAGTLPAIDLSIKIGTSAATTMTAFVDNSAFATVFTSASYMPVAGINTITFIAPFNWDGTSNIVLEFCHGNGSSTLTMSRTVKSDATSYVSSVKTNVNAATAAAVICADVTTNLLSYSVRPQFIFNGQAVCSSPRAAVVATVTPAPAITATATPAAICQGTSTNLNVTSPNDPNYTYNWMPGNLTGAAQTVTPGSSVVYSVTATDATGGANSGCVNATTVAVTVNANPSAVTVTPAADTLCQNAILQLTTTGGTIGGTGVIGADVTSSDVTTPFRGFYGGSKVQMLFTAAELTAMGVTNMTPIWEITFGLATFTSPYTFNGFTVGMKNTPSTILGTSLETGVSEVLAPSAYVLSGTAPFAATLTLTTPFSWDGTSNLLIETCFNNNDGGGVAGNSAAVAYTATATYQTAYFSGDNTPTVCSAPGSATQSYFRPNVGFNFVTPTQFTWAPLTDLYTDAAATIAYTGTAATSVYTKPTANVIYTATSTSVNSCTNSATTTITLDDLAISLVSSTNITCNGLTDGTITVTTTGGFAPVKYSVDNGATWQGSNAFTGLIAGSYNVAVKDTNNCTVVYTSNPVVIAEPTLVNITSVIKTDLTTCAGSDGTITITANGGTGVLNYSIDNGASWQLSGVYAGLPSGSYDVKVKDANGCTTTYASNPVVIATPVAVVIDNVVFDNNSCFNSDDAHITVTISGGTAPYEFSINGGSSYVSNGGAFNNLAPGSYSVYVRDNSSCIAIYTGNPIVITEPDSLIVTLGKTDVLCNGGATGTAFAAVTGGTAPYDYLWAPGGSTNDTIFGLISGSYSVGILDDNGCTASSSITINEPAVIDITNVTPVNLICFNGTDGSITITTTGGSGIMEYSIDNGVTYQFSNAFTGLIAGTYNVKVKDANNCTLAYASNPVVLTQPASGVDITTVLATDNTCFDGSAGTITVSASGGTGVLQYSIDNGANWQLSNAFSGLIAGNYTVKVKDANECAYAYASNPVIIGEPTEITYTNVTFTEPLCNGALTGSITITATGGTGTLEYSIDNGTTWSTSNIFNAVSGGSYTLVVKDANGCEVAYLSNPLVVTQPPAVAITNVAVVDILCFGGNNGSITVTATGGSTALLYSIDNGTTFQASNAFSGLIAGNYPLVVKDSNNCTLAYASNPVVIGGPTAALSITNVVSTDVNCYGVNDGTITITATGGTPPYQYSINNGGTWQISGNYTGLFAASRIVMVKDLNGCTATWSSNPVVITMPATAIANPTVTSTNVLCLNGSDGSITMSTTGGTPGYEYSIDNGITYQTSGFFGGLPNGSYTLKVKDANGCIKAYASNPLVISEPATAVSVSNAVGTDLICNSGADGSIMVTATGGTGALQYSADNGVTWTTNSTITGLAAGDHYIRVKDANGCTDIYTGNPITLTEPIPIIITGISTTDVLCNGSTDGSIEVYGIGGTGILEYSIDGGLTWQSGYSFTGIPAGSYTVMTKDDNNCTMAYSSNPVIINEPDAINISNVGVTDNLCYGTSTAVIDITAIGGTGILEYTINNGLSWTSANLFTGLMAGTYNIRVRDENLCTRDYYANPVVITDPDQIIIVNVDSTNVTSYGGHDGTIQVVAYGGTGVLQYSVNNGTTWQVGNLFIGLITGGYYVQVKDANGCIVTYGTNPVIINEPDGINENEGASAVSVYPNPTESEITIQGTFQDEILSIEILTIEGKLLDMVSIDDFVANNMTAKYVFAAEVKGIYFVRLITTNNVYLKKISVN